MCFKTIQAKVFVELCLGWDFRTWMSLISILRWDDNTEWWMLPRWVQSAFLFWVCFLFVWRIFMLWQLPICIIVSQLVWNWNYFKTVNIFCSSPFYYCVFYQALVEVDFPIFSKLYITRLRFVAKPPNYNYFKKKPCFSSPKMCYLILFCNIVR